MRRRYPTGFQDGMALRMLAGELVLTICSDTGVPGQTLHRWKYQALMDAGLVEGIDFAEVLFCVQYIFESNPCSWRYSS